MRAWSVHLPPAGAARRTAVPIVLPERFSWPAALFGVLWLLAQRIWWAAIGLVGLGLLLGALLPPAPALVAAAAVQVLLGYHAHDLRRAALGGRGWTTAGTVLAPTEDAALARLLQRQPELAAEWGRAVLA